MQVTEISGTTTVGELASAIPASVRVFQQFGIDFCCGGRKTLAEACATKNVPLENVLAGVEKAQEPSATFADTHWDTASAAELIDHIVETHHVFLKSEMPRIAGMLAKVISVHGDRHPESLPPLAPVYAGLKAELDQHMMKEERILFPLIKQLELANGSGGQKPPMPVFGPIRVMESEHESAGDALRTMSQLTNGYQLPDDACGTYRALFDALRGLEADLHLHIHLENNILFPKAVELSS